MSAEDIEYMGDYKEFPTKESALDWLDNYLSLDERNNLIRVLQQEPKTGHWIRITNGALYEKYVCSECGRQIADGGIEGLLCIKYPYCHCGAKMEGE